MKSSLIPRATAVTIILMMTATICPAGARAADKEEELSVKMMTPNVATARTTVQLLVRVPPHAENRLLRVTIDSAGYYRSSDVQLDGDRAATMHSVRWPGIPHGEYEVVARLIRSDGKHRTIHGGRLIVIGPGF
jgi:hypothetical protein